MTPVELLLISTDDALGYGNLSVQLGRALRRAGCDVRAVETRNLRLWPAEDVAADPRERDVVRVCVSAPPQWAWGGARWRVGFTMWETDRLPAGVGYRYRGGKVWRRRGYEPGPLVDLSWVGYCDAADLVIVPSEHNRAVFHHDGVRAPVAVVPLGLDPATWRPLERRAGGLPPVGGSSQGYVSAGGKPPVDESSQGYPSAGGKDTYTFLMHGRLDPRKGVDLAYAAFWRAFGRDPSVRLVLKTREGTLLGQPKVHGANQPVRFLDRNVHLARGDWRLCVTRNGTLIGGLLRLMQMADCYIFPSRGEGWGLPPREAAATGLPCIVPRHTGFDDGLLDRWAYPLERLRAVPALVDPWGPCGSFLEPDVEELAQRMVWCREHRAEAGEFGRRASTVVRAQTWDRTAEALLAAVCERFGFEPKELQGG